MDTALGRLTVEAPTLQITYRIIRPDGQVVWLQRHSHAYFDEHGKVERIIGMVVDVTERKAAEDALRESEQKFRSVFRESGVGMVIVSPEGRYLAANRTFCDCLGYTEQELLERTVESLTFPADWQRSAKSFRRHWCRTAGFSYYRSGAFIKVDTSYTPKIAPH